jgi:glycerophosphoryl diester phosphodiesterase
MMNIIAHRGFSAQYPENTLLAFKKAIEAGADGIETDLRLSLDEKIILFHNRTLKDSKRNNVSPESLSLSELQKLDLGNGEHIPELNELLELVEGKITLILEIKYNAKTYKRLCEILIRQIENKVEWVEVSCFEDKVLEYTYTLNPNVRLHKLIKDRSVLEADGMEEKYEYVEYFDINVKLHKIALEKGLIERRKVIFWTVDKEDLTKEIEAGLYGVMKNDI